MVSDEIYALCLPVLQDESLEEEDKTDKLEDLLKEETDLRGKELEYAILDALWQFKEGPGASSPPPIRSSRRPSPAPWQNSSTGLASSTGSPRLQGASPLAPPGFLAKGFNRSLSYSTAASPLVSPRPSPRLLFATPAPALPHSPKLDAYVFANDPSPSKETFGDSQSEIVDWLVNEAENSEDVDSISSSFVTGLSTPGGSALNAAAPEFSFSNPAQKESQIQQDMTPYDMLRSILGPSRTDDEIDEALASKGYDLGTTVAALMETAGSGNAPAPGPSLTHEEASYLIGKSMTPDVRPTTPADQKSGVICKFFLSQGSCLRADCRFSHELGNHVCKYWLAGHCIAGDECVFSHDPTYMMNRLDVNGAATPPNQKSPGTFDLQDHGHFPGLGTRSPRGSSSNLSGLGTSPGMRFFQHQNGEYRPRSRPHSRQQHSRENLQAAPSLDDTDAFPTLGAVANGKFGKRHHGKRGGHGHGGPKEPMGPSSLADVVRMSPSPAPSEMRMDSKRFLRTASSASLRNGEHSPAAMAIPAPRHIPWLETGDRANRAYLRARQEAIKHGGLRNKFLQTAAQAWNRNDARAAKALSLRGQSENDLMRKAHREAARELYEERNRHQLGGTSSPEIYVDLHGLHPDEAVEYLERVLLENGKEARPVYAITGTSHHSKNGKDKVARALRSFLNEWRYAYREFSVPGDRYNMGGILGIDARSWDKSLDRSDGRSATETDDKNGVGAASESVDILAQGVEIGDGKVKLLVRDTSNKTEPNRTAAR